MKVSLKPYQRETVEKLVKFSETLLSLGGDQEIVFKAPTGSGKTVMMTAFLERFREEEIGDFAFVWVSVNNLHAQSMKSLERNFSEGHFRLYELPDTLHKLHEEENQGGVSPVWKSKFHSDGTMFDNMFIAGIGQESGETLTYHIHISFWDTYRIPELEKAPEWDGHTAEDVLSSLMKL